MSHITSPSSLASTTTQLHHQQHQHGEASGSFRAAGSSSSASGSSSSSASGSSSAASGLSPSAGSSSSCFSHFCLHSRKQEQKSGSSLSAGSSSSSASGSSLSAGSSSSFCFSHFCLPSGSSPSPITGNPSQSLPTPPPGRFSCLPRFQLLSGQQEQLPIVNPPLPSVPTGNVFQTPPPPPPTQSQLISLKAEKAKVENAILKVYEERAKLYPYTFTNICATFAYQVVLFGVIFTIKTSKSPKHKCINSLYSVMLAGLVLIAGLCGLCYICVIANHFKKLETNYRTCLKKLNARLQVVIDPDFPPEMENVDTFFLAVPVKKLSIKLAWCFFIITWVAFNSFAILVPLLEFCL